MHGDNIILERKVLKICSAKHINFTFKNYKTKIKAYSHIYTDYNRHNNKILLRMSILKIYQNLNKNSLFCTL